MNMYVVLMCSRGCSDDGSQGKAEGEISESAATLRGAREGLQPVVEDWHAKVCLLGACLCIFRLY